MVYAEDILILNAANRNFNESAVPSLYCIAVPPGTPEVKRLETSRKVIFESVREGFAAAYDMLVQDPKDRVSQIFRNVISLIVTQMCLFSCKQGKGMQIAKEIWPDSILLQPPAHLQQQAPAIQQNSNVKNILNIAAQQAFVAQHPAKHGDIVQQQPESEFKRLNFMAMLKKITRKIVG